MLRYPAVTFFVIIHAGHEYQADCHLPHGRPLDTSMAYRPVSTNVSPVKTGTST